MGEYASMFGHEEVTGEIDVDSLLREIGLDTDELEWRKEFIGFDDNDADRLSALKPLFEANAETLGELLADTLTQDERIGERINRSPMSVDELIETQKAYFVTLTNGEYGVEYVTNRARFGTLQDGIGLQLNQYIGQYAVYYEFIHSLLTERAIERLSETLQSSSGEAATDGGAVAAGDKTGGPTSRALVEEEFTELQADLTSIRRIMLLDMQIVADGYSHSDGQSRRGGLERDEQLSVELEAELAKPIADLSQSTEDVSQSSQEISILADEQSDRLQSIATEVSNMSATVEEIAYSTTEVKDNSERAEKLAEDGQDAATDAMAVMDDVGEAVEEVSNDVSDLQTRVGEIDSVVEVINDIAEQTNILALNASIEAARAGEAGAGFAVVADEVKSLAGDSQERAQEIETLVSDIENDTEQTVDSLTETTDQLERGADSVSEAMELLDDISEAIKETAHGIREVSKATDEQAASSEEVASMLDELVDRAETVATEAEEIAAANEEQAMTIEGISQTVGQLTGDLPNSRAVDRVINAPPLEVDLSTAATPTERC